MQIVHSFTHLHKNLIICFATNKKSYQQEIQDNCSKFNKSNHRSLITYINIYIFVLNKR